MSNPPRIWLDYRPVRIGWVISDQNIALLETAAAWNSCLWGGLHNCIIPAHDTGLSDSLVRCFGVDVLLPVEASEATTAYINRFRHLGHHRWADSIFQRQACQFADIRHPVREIFDLRDDSIRSHIKIPTWDDADHLHPLLTLLFGRFPTPDADIPDYKGGVEKAFGPVGMPITPTDDAPASLLECITPLGLNGYGLTRRRNSRGWLDPGVVLGSVTDFDALTMFWNLRAAGAHVIFYDQTHSARLKSFANDYLAKLRGPTLGGSARVNIWTRRDRHLNDDS
jgi:hypothetical protein